MEKNILRSIGILLISLVFGGCADKLPMRTSLTEMGTVSKTEYAVNGLKLMRVVNVTGLGPEEVVGSITINPDTNYFEKISEKFTLSNDFPDAMTLRVVKKPMYKERRFGGASIDDVINIKDSLQTYQMKIAEIAKLQLNEAVLSSIAKEFENNDALGKTELIKQTNRILLDIDTNSVIGENNVDKLQDEIETIKLNLNKLTSEVNAISKSFKKEGVLVVNWERESDLTAGISMQSKASEPSVKTKKILTGFSILGNPSIVTLYISDDIFSRHPSRFQHLIELKRAFITYYQVRSEYIAFAESKQGLMQSSIDLDVSKLIRTIPPLLKDGIKFNKMLENISLNINGLYGAISMSNASGILDAKNSSVHTVKMDDFDYAPYDDFNQSIPIISMRANLQEMAIKYQNRGNP